MIACRNSSCATARPDAALVRRRIGRLDPLHRHKRPQRWPVIELRAQATDACHHFSAPAPPRSYRSLYRDHRLLRPDGLLCLHEKRATVSKPGQSRQASRLPTSFARAHTPTGLAHFGQDATSRPPFVLKAVVRFCPIRANNARKTLSQRLESETPREPQSQTAWPHASPSSTATGACQLVSNSSHRRWRPPVRAPVRQWRYWTGSSASLLRSQQRDTEPRLSGKSQSVCIATTSRSLRWYLRARQSHQAAHPTGGGSWRRAFCWGANMLQTPFMLYASTSFA